ncbi:MAG: hypothetical protein ABFD50_23135 [Smithella sp.]
MVRQAHQPVRQAHQPVEQACSELSKGLALIVIKRPDLSPFEGLTKVALDLELE